MNWSNEVPADPILSDPETAAPTASHGDVASVDFRELPTGTLLIIRTKNSTYRLSVRNASRQEGLLQGGRLFPQGVAARIEGSTFGGSQLCAGWIDVGCFLEVTVGGARVVTSRIQSIEVDFPPL